ncbi:hypothetical protein [Pseudobythopirellula maris]|uniref:hypothetical protein n=1 Tax=Pseudobythopirellula maris TaxID=2527991 RepID=UPI0018D40F82|nr:hypothetical protein [Pseudobythopirellula maris]
MTNTTPIVAISNGALTARTCAGWERLAGRSSADELLAGVLLWLFLVNCLVSLFS